jgi:hypothetical protein
MNFEVTERNAELTQVQRRREKSAKHRINAADLFLLSEEDDMSRKRKSRKLGTSEEFLGRL